MASFIALCSAALGKPVQSHLAVMGEMSLGGTIVQVRNLPECMQVTANTTPNLMQGRHKPDEGEQWEQPGEQ